MTDQKTLENNFIIDSEKSRLKAFSMTKHCLKHADYIL